MLDEVLEVVRSISDSYSRALALEQLIPYLPQSRRDPVISEALDAAQIIADAPLHIRALTAIAATLEQIGERVQVQKLQAQIQALNEQTKGPVAGYDAIVVTSPPPSDSAINQASPELAAQSMTASGATGTDISANSVSTDATSAQAVEALETQLVIAGYTSDSLGSDITSVDDLMGIEAEVKILCAVIAATDVHPPLALGLFGEWGSGKSFFMRMMEKQIRIQSASGTAGFCKNVVQLWFNAWHYSDTDLWASLASEVFEQLSWVIPPANTVETAAYRREQLLSESASAQSRKDEAERQKSEAEAEQRRREEQLAKLKSGQKTLGKSTIARAFTAGVLKEIVTEPTVKAELAETERRVDQTFEEAVQTLNYPSVAALKADVLTQERTLQGWRQLWTILRLTWNSRNTQALLWLACGLIVAVILGLLLWTYRHEIEGVAVAAAALLLALATAFAPAIGMVQKVLRVAGRAQEQINGILEKEQAELDSRINNAVQSTQQSIDNAKACKEKAAADIDEAEKKIHVIQNKLDNLRADRQMVEFIEARHASTDYTRRRGSIGKARDDFEKLTAFLKQVQNSPPRTSDKTGQAEVTPSSESEHWRIDRIILYIDDLDRCPEEKVMDVLQAIHLLLAFELFVVVVGVDPRWLLYSVKQRSPAFQERVNEHAVTVDVDEHDHTLRTTPLNYLEKIFQIPFTLRPMTKTGFNQLIDKLIQGDRVSPFLDTSPRNGKPVDDGATGVTVGTDNVVVDRELLPITSSVASTTVPSSVPAPHADVLKAEYLAIDDWERECMKKCYCLIPSPRATKRFVNIYRLLRASAAMGTVRDIQSDERQHQQRAMMLLLAILIGYPAEATEIMSSLIDDQTPETHWWGFVKQWQDIAERTMDGTNDSIVADRFAAIEGVTTHQQQSQQPTGVNGAANLQGSTSRMMNPMRWRELLDKMESVRSNMPESENDNCTAFILWAPEVARYSFRSGLTLLARRMESKMPTGP